jgi:hypothetical protein
MSDFWNFFWLVFEIFFFFAYLMILFQIIGDLFRDRKLGGFGKAVWVFFLISAPVITALVYLIARGNGMVGRQQAAVAQAEEATKTYIKDVAGSSPATEIAQAKALLDAGAIDAAEYAQLKAKVLATQA